MASNLGRITKFPSQEIDDERLPREVSLDPAMLDARHEHDHLTPWEDGDSVWPEIVLYAAAAVGIVLAVAWVAGAWPFA
jgi:hypothetical protein